MSDAPEDTGRDQTTGRFTRSGNPAGRVRGVKNKATIAAEAMMQGEAEGLTRRCIEMALSGDGTAMRLCMERIYPIRKGRAIKFDLPELNTTKDVVQAISSIGRQAAAGELTVEEAQLIGSLIEVQRRAIETEELEARVAMLEEAKKHA